MRSDRESAVISIWLALSLVLFALVIYTGIVAGRWGPLLAVLVAGELVLAGLGALGLRFARRR